VHLWSNPGLSLTLGLEFANAFDVS